MDVNQRVKSVEDETFLPASIGNLLVNTNREGEKDARGPSLLQMPIFPAPRDPTHSAHLYYASAHTCAIYLQRHTHTHTLYIYMLLKRAILSKDTGHYEVPGCGHQLKDITYLKTA